VNSATLTILVAVESADDIDVIRRRCVQAVEAETQTLDSDDLLAGNVNVSWNMHLSSHTYCCNDPETTWRTSLNVHPCQSCIDEFGKQTAYYRENDYLSLVAERDRLIAERQRLTDENDKGVRALWDEKNKFMEALEAEMVEKKALIAAALAPSATGGDDASPSTSAGKLTDGERRSD
jgi:hypothetical protein